MSKRTWLAAKAAVAALVSVSAVLVQFRVTPARAGELTTTTTRSSAVVRTRPPAPGANVNVRVLDPGLLPAATELEDRLLYHLRHLPHLLWPVLAGPATGGSVPVEFSIDVQLDPVPTFPVRALSPRPPFLRTAEAEALFSSRVPLQAQVTVWESGRRRVVAQTVLVAQSTGFTITAGTTKPAADLLAEKIVHYLKTHRRQGGFLSSR